METETNKNWTVVTSNGESVAVSATRVEMDEGRSRVSFFSGDELVASFLGTSAFYEKVEETSL